MRFEQSVMHMPVKQPEEQAKHACSTHVQHSHHACTHSYLHGHTCMNASMSKENAAINWNGPTCAAYRSKSVHAPASLVTTVTRATSHYPHWIRMARTRIGHAMRTCSLAAQVCRVRHAGWLLHRRSSSSSSSSCVAVLAPPLVAPAGKGSTKVAEMMVAHQAWRQEHQRQLTTSETGRRHHIQT
jgi:hypothetical protein